MTTLASLLGKNLLIRNALTGACLEFISDPKDERKEEQDSFVAFNPNASNKSAQPFVLGRHRATAANGEVVEHWYLQCRSIEAKKDNTSPTGLNMFLILRAIKKIHSEGKHIPIGTRSNPVEHLGSCSLTFEPVAPYDSHYRIKSGSHYLVQNTGSEQLTFSDTSAASDEASFWSIFEISYNVRAATYSLRTDAGHFLDGRQTGFPDPFGTKIEGKRSRNEPCFHWTMEPVEPNTFAIKSIASGAYLNGNIRNTNMACMTVRPPDAPLSPDYLWVFRPIGVDDRGAERYTITNKANSIPLGCYEHGMDIMLEVGSKLKYHTWWIVENF